MSTWLLYILRCADDTLYTGITTDLRGRLAKHNSGKGAKYTRGRGPVEVVWHQRCASEGDAKRWEMEIKRLSKKQKEELVKAGEGGK
ncbi:MAG: GIY-YIG nuclease family protein [Patescibacteria group bacterium]